MAYVNETPWHGLGNPLSPNQPIEVWQREAGMDWSIAASPVHYQSQDAMHQSTMPRCSTALIVASPVRRLEPLPSRPATRCAGVLSRSVSRSAASAGDRWRTQGGKKLWALARTGQEMVLKGNDQVKAYLLLATACDGTLATTASSPASACVQQHPGYRHQRCEQRNQVRHSTTFDADKVKQQLGIVLVHGIASCTTCTSCPSSM